MPDRTILFLATADDPRGPAAVTAFNAAAKRMGMGWSASTAVDGTATRRIAFAPDAVDAEVWTLAKGDAAALDAAVMRLITQLLGGRLDAPPMPVKPPPPKPVITAKVGRETAGRRGKGVTTVFDLPLSDTQLEALAQTLKNRCGTGGTVKDRRIEIQGDNRERIIAELEKLGYKVKRVGG